MQNEMIQILTFRITAFVFLLQTFYFQNFFSKGKTFFKVFHCQMLILASCQSVYDDQKDPFQMSEFL